MKKFFLITLTLILANSFLKAEEASLPVLKVSFSDKLNYDEYVQGEMILTDTDGEEIRLPAKFKTRGATALQYSMKPSFNMKLEGEDGEEIDTNLLNLRKASSFILDAMAIDRICMRNRVCFDLWNEYSRLPYDTDFDGRNGTVGKFVIVYMNDVYKGIYCLTDKINRKLLDLKKPKVEDNGDVTIRGVLYKSGTTDISNQNTTGFFNDYMVYVAAYHDAWELKEPEDYPGIPAWQPLINFYEDRTTGFVKENFYQENLIDYSLLIGALCITDNWGNKNKYFSMRNYEGNAEARKFIVTPWDLDTSLGGHYNGDYYDGSYSQWTMSQISNTAVLPFSVCFADKDWKNQMKERWIELSKTTFSVENVASIMYGYCDLFEKSGAWEEYVEYWNNQSSRPKYVENLRGEIDLIVEWYRKRVSEINEYFGVDEAGVEGITDSFDIEYPIYSLQGLKVDKSKLQPGNIYIRNGKKFIYR